MHTYICLSSRRFLTERYCPGIFVCRVLSGVVLSVPLLSEYIHYNRRLNITFNFRFNIYEKNSSVMSHDLGPLSQTVTPSRTPSNLIVFLYGRPLPSFIY